MSCDAPLGWLPAQRCFRLMAPTAVHVELVERRHPDQEPQRVTAMRRMDVSDGAGIGSCRVVWQADISAPLGCYRFRVHRPWDTIVVADPWARAVVRRKAAGHPTWSVVTSALPPARGGVTINPDAAVLLEMHLADATHHASAGVTEPGTYRGFAESHAAAIGGARHALGLAVDAVELLPVTSWPVLEGEREDSDQVGKLHSSNYFSNHWGYMPSFFLAASERFSDAWPAAAPNSWVGMSDDGSFTDPALELRAMVDTLHARGLGVIVDLVYNHVSAHDSNPLLLLDPGTWFHRTAAGRMRSHSGCGNDLNTAAPEMRALVLASVRRWFTEIGVDGVRLDLAELIDDRTLREIRDVALAIRPDALLIAEPWSLGGYRPEHLVSLGWKVWDDRYRNGLKGREPSEPGLLRADPHAHGRGLALARFLSGGGHQSGGALPGHNDGVSYLVSHDGYTLADFWRLNLAEITSEELVHADEIATLSPELAAMVRLSNAALLGTRGPVMMHLGQSWGRAKLRRDASVQLGVADENSYDRDDHTNHIDWRHRTQNAALVAFVSAWIAARRRWLAPAFVVPQRPQLLHDDASGAGGYVLSGPQGNVSFCLNPSLSRAHITLPGGGWRLVMTEPTVTMRSHEWGGTELWLAPQSAVLVVQSTT